MSSPVFHQKHSSSSFQDSVKIKELEITNKKLRKRVEGSAKAENVNAIKNLIRKEEELIFAKEREIKEWEKKV